MLYYFGNKISEAIVEDMDQFLKDNKFKLRNRSRNVSDYYKSTDHDYVVHCEVWEGKAILLEVNVTVPVEEQASAMCDNWKNHSQEIYAYIMKNLM